MLLDTDSKRSCSRFLYHPPRTQTEWLKCLSESDYSDGQTDSYGVSPLFETLTNRVTELLGKPSGTYVNKGVIAQQIALRVHAERSEMKPIVLNQKSHLLVDEQDAIRRLTGLDIIALGSDHEHFTLGDLQAIKEPISAVALELPLRRAGFKAPDFKELAAISQWCREKQIPLHIDGARLWEAAAGYGCTPAQMASLADSVYVSFYKGLGALGGSLVVGDESFIKEVEAWKPRYGADVYHMFPYAIAALEGLDQQLPRMTEYVERARALANLLKALPGAKTTPNPPRTNAFQLFFPGHLEETAERLAREQKERDCWLIDVLYETAVPNLLMTEIQVGSGHIDINDADIIQLFAAILPTVRLHETVN